jgi:hypothetical protein
MRDLLTANGVKARSLFYGGIRYFFKEIREQQKKREVRRPTIRMTV